MARNVVIAGGGFGGFYAARALERLLPANSARVTLVNEANFMLYTPLLSGVAAATLDPRHVVVPLRSELKRTEFVIGSVTGADPAARTLGVRRIDGVHLDLEHNYPRTVVTDQRQIHNSIDAMSAAVVNQDADALFKQVSKDFQHKGMNRTEMHDRVARAIKLHKVREAFISNFTAIEVARAAGKAKVSFHVRVDDEDGQTVFFALCEADFVLEADQWKLKGIEFFNAVANQDQPLNIPLPQ